MPADAPRCIDCNTPLKAVPSWLFNAKVAFTCGTCHKRSTRGTATARFEPAVEPRAVALADDTDADVDDVEELEDIDLDADVEADDVKDDDA